MSGNMAELPAKYFNKVINFNIFVDIRKFKSQRAKFCLDFHTTCEKHGSQSQPLVRSGMISCVQESNRPEGNVRCSLHALRAYNLIKARNAYIHANSSELHGSCTNHQIPLKRKKVLEVHVFTHLCLQIGHFRGDF